ncbi:three-Cys-motif partner protein TcmP [Sphingomicrobium arenosum]|uniref:three-Cys-motif partner protein TcmP n=1 Tax=Sphingomicrobium arenosum TaxID=2233861 RepID=UPI002240105C|nr:three-Cys-motif partner protein TcmP [Sphingomicrobium arenosum]
MAIDVAHYEGREQAFVKHTFLDKYLPALIGKVCSRYDEFVYVDGFAGPWKSAAGENFDDTSFGIALNHMTSQRLLYLSRGRNVRMRAFLVEKDPSSFAQLQRAVALYPKIEITPLNGKMEDHVAAIVASIPQESFSFTLIDPKGFPAIGSMMPLLQRQNAEALVNFMFDFANRFGGTDLIPALEEWLSTSAPDDWRKRIKAVSGEQRERLYEELAVQALRQTSGYVYAPVITVDKVLHNRPLYKLIFLTRHSEGLKVFRDSERSALDAQAITRSASKAKKREACTLMGDLFADGFDAVPNDRSTQVIRRSEEEASRRLQAMLTTANSGFCKWKECWPPILEELSVTHSWLGRHVNDRRKAGQISAPAWPSERTQIPRDEQQLRWNG